jgi:drug/metabolite transporter (DMT)-like permease
MLLAAAILSTMSAMVRHLGQDLHPFEIAFFRNLFGGIALFPFIMYHGTVQLRSSRPWLLVSRGLLGAVSMLAWFYGLSKVPIAEATALSFVGVVFASLGAVVFLGEVMRIRRWMAVIVSFTGAMVILRPGFSEISLGAIMVVFASVTWGLAVLFVKTLSRTHTPVCIVAWTSVSLTVLTAIPAFMEWQWPDGRQLGLLVLIGIMATAGHLAVAKSLQLAEATLVIPLDFTRLIWAGFIGLFVFGEIPDIWTVTGAVLIAGSAAYISGREARLARRKRGIEGQAT